MTKLKWGVLGAATIAIEQMIPAIQNSQYGQVRAIASRSASRVKEVSLEFGIPIWFDNYDDLLSDSEIQAIYIPLPNHLHVDYAIRALRAGKHVLVEKPLGMGSEEVKRLLTEMINYPHLKVMEAFMYKFHPQWNYVKSLVQQGVIGPLKMIESSFSFFDDDPSSITNIKKFGGGSLMDVGCYSVSLSRYLFDSEPDRVMASATYDPEMDIDIYMGGVMEFSEGKSVFFSSVRQIEHQAALLLGTTGKIRFEIPFNPPADQPVSIWIEKNGESPEEKVFQPCDQYGLQADAFSRAVLENTDLPVDFQDSVNNMKVLDALAESGRIKQAVTLR